MQSLNNIQGIANLYSNLGNLEYAKGQNNKALEYYEKSIEKHKQLGDILHVAQVDISIGVVYERTEHWFTSLKKYRNSIRLFERRGSVQSLINAYVN